MELIGHRANSLCELYKYYFKYDMRAVEIDVQLTQDKKIAVLHDCVNDKRMRNLAKLGINTLDEVLKNVPADLVLYIEIKRYTSEKAKQNKLPNDIACRIIQAVKKRGKKNVVYSSFDRDIVTIIMKNRRDAMLLLENPEDFQNIASFPWVCLDRNILSVADLCKECFEGKKVYAYNVPVSEKNKLEEMYPFVTGCIVDTPLPPPPVK